MTRTSLLLPDGWKPKRGSVVHCLPTKDDPQPPEGLWRLMDPAPRTGRWWGVAADDEARTWAAEHPDRVTSRCIDVAGISVVPWGYRPARASDLTDPGSMR